MFITPAFADAATSATAAAGAPAGNLFQSTPIMPLLLVLLVFYFMVIRPQNKRAVEHRTMITGLQKGDRVVTGGGLIGKVKKIVSDEEIVLELGEGVEVHALRSTIMAKKE
jgi:preprotein translocase subunit YajC